MWCVEWCVCVVWSGECGVCVCGVWSGECGVWSVEWCVEW